MSNAEQTRSPASPALTPALPDRGAVTADGIAGHGAAAPLAAGPAQGHDAQPRHQPGSKGRLGWIVAGSLATGFVAALLLVAAPFIPVEESAITGAVLLGFALGWAMLALLSKRFTDQPQRWAAAPAVFMGAGGVLLVTFGSPMREALSWVWPPVLLALVIWMLYQARRTMPSRSGRILLYLLFAVLAISAVGGGYETISEAADTNAYPMPGTLIDVGGYSLHLHCTGSGSPTVVLEPGAGEMSANMGWITPAVARHTRVCVYDRAGRGWSQTANTPQDGARIATDLHTLLHSAGIPGPYVLAGHSFGGLYVRIFAAHYPNEVAGLVLVDSTASREPAKPATPAPGDNNSYNAIGRISTLASIPARVGLARLYAQVSFGTLPPRSADEVRASTANASTVASTVEEYLRASASTQQAASLRDFGDKPLAVLTASVGHDAAWMTAQNKTATLSTNSVHRVIAGATHEALVAEQKYAGATTQAILDVVNSIRHNQPLDR
jgi:pimeloyl-ACP methyl ester carboxylesterase